MWRKRSQSRQLLDPTRFKLKGAEGGDTQKPAKRTLPDKRIEKSNKRRRPIIADEKSVGQDKYIVICHDPLQVANIDSLFERKYEQCEEAREI